MAHVDLHWSKRARLFAQLKSGIETGRASGPRAGGRRQARPPSGLPRRDAGRVRRLLAAVARGSAGAELRPRTSRQLPGGSERPPQLRRPQGHPARRGVARRRLRDQACADEAQLLRRQARPRAQLLGCLCHARPGRAAEPRPLLSGPHARGRDVRPGHRERDPTHGRHASLGRARRLGLRRRAHLPVGELRRGKDPGVGVRSGVRLHLPLLSVGLRGSRSASTFTAETGTRKTPTSRPTIRCFRREPITA